jgi:hypothetical protein
MLFAASRFNRGEKSLKAARPMPSSLGVTEHARRAIRLPQSASGRLSPGSFKVMVKNISVSASSRSSLRVAGHASSRTSSNSSAEAGARSGSGFGSASVSSTGLVFEATYHPHPEGLDVRIRAFELADPGDTRIDQSLLLRPGERRVISVRRAHGKPAAQFELSCVDGGVQILCHDV